MQLKHQTGHVKHSSSMIRGVAIVILFFCYVFTFIMYFTAQCTLVQSAVLRSHVVCLSVRPSVCLSVTLVDCDHMGWKSRKLNLQQNHNQTKMLKIGPCRSL